MANTLQYYTFSSLIAFLVFIIISITLKTNKNKSKTTKPTPKLPPGPWRLPLIGNIHNLICSLPHRRLRNLSEKYGPLMYLQLGEIPHIVVSSPEMAREFMKTHDIHFAQRPRVLLGETFYEKDIMFGVYGDYWRMLKKICVEELLSQKRVNSFREIRVEEVSNLIEDFRSNSGLPVNLSAKIFSFLSVIVSRAAFGKKCEDREMFISSVNEALRLVVGSSGYELFPSRKWLHWIGDIRSKFSEKLEIIDKILDDIVVGHKADNSESKRGCLLDVLLDLQQNGNNLPFRLETENIKAVIMDLFVGGSETTAITMEWAMLEMLKNPRIMKKAQSEVRQVFRGKRHVDETDLNELKYLKMVIKETLRFHPTGPLIAPREPRESCIVSGYYIPAKARVFVNAWAIGRDARYWEDPERFWPERFIENTRVDFKGTHLEFIPFGAGRRMCPGIAFAVASIELPLAMMLLDFDWKLPDGIDHENLDMSESFGLTVRRKVDLYAIPIPHINDHSSP